MSVEPYYDIHVVFLDGQERHWYNVKIVSTIQDKAFRIVNEDGVNVQINRAYTKYIAAHPVR